jgi:glycosyltransferase involved in cell wall biosynthesis
MVEPGDVSAIAQAIKSYILRPKKRLVYGQKARERALTVHDAAIGAKKLAGIYERILAGH